MTQVNLTIGDLKAQKEFRIKQKEFIECFPGLDNAIRIAFDRQYLATANLTDSLVFDLGKEGINRFSEIGLLCANGLGDASIIILRSMFEYLVTAKYLHMHPEKSQDFLDYLYVHMHTVYSQIKRTYGESRLPESIGIEKTVEENFNKVRERFSYKGSGGKQRKKTSWSNKSMVDMAIEAKLGDFVVPAYYFGIEVAHPNIIKIANAQKGALKTISQALMVSHRMVIELLILQHEYFNLEELKPLVGQCLQDFDNAWRGYAKSLINEEFNQ
ncbi:MAG: hypothetical protein H6634_00010 [Anaerolineales bacterium]|nr:hypothetical protein [Anaerolineales bacterium]